MIREAEPFAYGSLTMPLRGGSAPAVAATTVAAPANVESTEQEIARLTWSVLDGSASMSDRQRLAQLVNAQHAVRRRIDR
jgi:hypothetical protein